MRELCIALTLLATVRVFAAGTPPGQDRQLDLNPALLKMPDNSWLDLRPKGTAYARMYSGCCAGAGYVWYFGGAHRGYKGNDVKRDRRQLYDGGVTETWAYRYKQARR